MGLKIALAALTVAVMSMSGAAKADDAVLTRFLSTQAGAAGVAAMTAGLGRCDTVLVWIPGFNVGDGTPAPDSLAVSCSYFDTDEDMDLEKTVIGQFTFFDGKPSLDGLTYLP